MSGSDYFHTKSAFLVMSPGSPHPLDGWYSGVPIIGAADTIVQRQGDCILNLGTPGSSCSVAIELVGLSLVKDLNSDILVRESQTTASTGAMTIKSDGTGNGGTFDSFFDVFFDVSTDNGVNWMDNAGTKTFTQSGSEWMTTSTSYILAGLVGDQDADFHTNLAAGQFDFYLVGDGVHDAGDGSMHIVEPVPIPAALWLFGSGLLGLIGISRRKKTV
ncbi:MAG: VPLPA-CTERM sorting domain-containing protein [Sedimenticola sp.]